MPAGILAALSGFGSGFRLGEGSSLVDLVSYDLQVFSTRGASEELG